MPRGADEVGRGDAVGAPPGKKVYSIWRAPFEVDEKYEPIRPIGKGAYGVVCSAKDMEKGEKCAIKKINSAFDNIMDARRTLREIKILQHLGKHENIIELKDLMKPAAVPFDDVYLVYELMDTDLHQIIRSSQPLSDDHVQVRATPPPLRAPPPPPHEPLLPSAAGPRGGQELTGLGSPPPPPHSQYFIYQILRGLKYVHSANILHRDLKPSNLLLNASCDLKICDFGLARSREEKQFMTEYVVTRWYRAPELLLSCEECSTGIDVWSAGCIFAELLQRKPLFAGKDYLDQIKLIVKTIGTPAEEDLDFIHSQKARAYIQSLPNSRRIPFGQLFQNSNPLDNDLCERMLQFNPQKRISVDDALQHPYLASLHDINTEPTSDQEFDCDFEGLNLDRHELMDLVYQEVEKFHPSLN